MGSSLNGTGLTFSSGATLNAVPVTSFAGQTGAVDPTTIGNLGSIVNAYYIVNSPTGNAGNATGTSYPIGTTVAGSSLAYNLYGTTQVYFGSSVTLTIYGSIGFRITHNTFISVASFPTQNSGVGANNLLSMISAPIIESQASNYNATCFYTTGLSGSWKSLSPFTNQNQGISCYGYSQSWTPAFWTRYA